MTAVAAGLFAGWSGLLPGRPGWAQAPTAGPTGAAGLIGGYAQRDEVQGFVARMILDHGFSGSNLLSLFSQVRPAETSIRLMTPAPAGTRRSWTTYRSRMVEPTRIREGVRFWREHAPILRQASEKFGVPEDIIVAIIGIETLYGRHTGDYRVIDTLTTLAFDYPRRSQFFLEELEQFLLMSRDMSLDPTSLRGSFAGAIGLPQFMPGSIRRHAVDFDRDGVIDLVSSPADAIGSVANFLAAHGWQPGGETHYPVLIENEERARPAVEAGIPPRMLRKELAALGVTSPRRITDTERLVLVDLPDGTETQYVLGTQNFYVITRYNRSYFYAMVVIELAQALRKSR